MDELTPIERSWMEGPHGSPSGSCLEAYEILEVAERGGRARNYDSRMAHIATCPGCRSTLKLLRETEAMRPRARLLPGWLPARTMVAAVAAIGLLIAWFGLHSPAVINRPGGNLAVRHAPVETTKPSPLQPAPKRSHTMFAEHKRPAPPKHLGEARRPSRLAMRHRRPRPASHGITPLTTTDSEAHGTLEGTVANTEILQGEVTMGGGIVEGEVRAKKPPPSGS
jgi:hypothetical protein